MCRDSAKTLPVQSLRTSVLETTMVVETTMVGKARLGPLAIDQESSGTVSVQFQNNTGIGEDQVAQLGNSGFLNRYTTQVRKRVKSSRIPIATITRLTL
jgi:hypothetical protein